MSQTPPALRQSSHPEPPSLTAAGPGRKAGSSGPEYLTVKPIFLQLTFSSPEQWHLDDLSIILRPSGVTDWHLCGVRAAVMSDSEDCVRESAAVVKRNVSDLNTVLWLLLSSPLVSSLLLSSFTPHIFSALPGGAFVLMRSWEGRCMTDWCPRLRSYLIGSRNTHWTSWWRRGPRWSTGTQSLSSR